MIAVSVMLSVELLLKFVELPVTGSRVVSLPGEKRVFTFRIQYKLPFFLEGLILERIND